MTWRMMYNTGDYVYLDDVPERVLCRVAAADDVALELEPLEGPWPPGTRLMRLDRAVYPVDARALWQARAASGSVAPRRAGRPDGRRLTRRGAAA